jgi:hypothetical protein
MANGAGLIRAPLRSLGGLARAAAVIGMEAFRIAHVEIGPSPIQI